jgi:hypothetical protein
LRTRDFVANDGVVVDMIKDEVPLGTEYTVYAGHPAAGVVRMYNTKLHKSFDIEMVWVVGPRSPGGALMCAQVLDIDEGAVA